MARREVFLDASLASALAVSSDHSCPGKDRGLTSCISFEIMREPGITDALTADGRFEQAGFRAMLREGDSLAHLARNLLFRFFFLPLAGQYSHNWLPEGRGGHGDVCKPPVRRGLDRGQVEPP